MKLPKIATDDLMLFGSLALAAIGITFVVGEVTGSGWLALGTGLVVYGLPAALITFLAAAEPPK